MEDHFERRLAAIVMADVVGYSTLIQRDETGTRALFNRLQQNLFVPLCRKHGGRIIKTMGDAFLLEFPSILKAVVCSVELQQQIKIHVENEASLDLQTMAFRFGINIGDIIVEGDDIHGDGVNVAARLQTAAQPGGICISENAYGQIKGKVDARFGDGGKVTLKNIEGDCQVYVWPPQSDTLDKPPKLEIAQLEQSATDAAQKASVAVIPFRNMSEDPEKVFFSEGITEDLITELSRFRELNVKARSASFYFKDQSMLAQEVGKNLGVSYIVQGSVRKAGNRIRVSVQLIDVKDGSQIWAERYDRNLDDIFEVQDEIIQSVASVLPTRLQRAQEDRVRRKSTEELSAYEYFLRGRWLHVNSSGTDSRALIYLKKAIEIYPQHAQSHAFLATVYAYSLFSLGVQYEDPESKARTYIDKALHFGKEDPKVHALVGEVFYYLGETSLARHHVEISLRLNPHDVEIRLLYGAVLSGSGFSEQALEVMELALAMDPLVTDYSKEWLAEVLYMLGRYEDTLEYLLSWQDPPPHTYAQVAACYAHLGEMLASKLAADQFREVCSEKADFERYAKNHARICVLEKDKENWLSGYRKAGLLA